MLALCYVCPPYRLWIFVILCTGLTLEYEEKSIVKTKTIDLLDLSSTYERTQASFTADSILICTFGNGTERTWIH